MRELDMEIRDVLRDSQLTLRPDLTETWAVARIREDIEIAVDCARDSAVMAAPAESARDLVKAARQVLRVAAAHDLERDQELAGLRRLGRAAKTRLLLTQMPVARAWLGPCCENFRQAWEALTDQASGIYERGEFSPTALFVTACCKLIDTSVNASAVVRASQEFKRTLEMTEDEYAEFMQSDLARKLRSSDL